MLGPSSGCWQQPLIYGRFGGSGEPAGDAAKQKQPAPESVSGKIRLGSPPFFNCFGEDPGISIPSMRPPPPNYPSETGSRVELPVHDHRVPEHQVVEFAPTAHHALAEALRSLADTADALRRLAEILETPSKDNRPLKESHRNGTSTATRAGLPLS